MSNEAIPENDSLEHKRAAMSAMALIQARKAQVERMAETRAKQEESAAQLESGGDLWSMLNSVNRD